jgi:cob(I)alamin adenosyltransferase
VNRAAARDAVEEANAAIGAAVSTCSLPSADEGVLLEVQYELIELADALAAGTPVPELPRLWRAARDHGGVVIPRGFAVLGGFSAAAGLLKLARAMLCRAARDAPDDVAAVLGRAGDVVLAFAFRAEERERSLGYVGSCAD